jgi:hypothetical protein
MEVKQIGVIHTPFLFASGLNDLVGFERIWLL